MKSDKVAVHPNSQQESEPEAVKDVDGGRETEDEYPPLPYDDSSCDYSENDSGSEPLI